MPSALLTGPPGTFEWVVVFVVILLLFGPRKLPEIARSLGRILDELRRASFDFRDQIMRIDEPEAPRTERTIDVAPAEADGDGEDRAPDERAGGEDGDDDRHLAG
jgi:TatA/E family protein of Tat protein translocase